MERLFSNYCTECEWVATRADNTAAELSERAIAHAVETGHNIDSTVDRPPNADERAEGAGGSLFDRSDPDDLGDRSDRGDPGDRSDSDTPSNLDDPNDGPSKEVRCLECEWVVSDESHPADDLAELAIEHFIVTQHAIEGDRQAATDRQVTSDRRAGTDRRGRGEPASGWASDWPPGTPE